MFPKHVLMIFFWFLSFPAIGGSPSATATAERYLHAMIQEDHEGMAAEMHPDALNRFKALIYPLFSGKSADQATKNLLPLFDGVSSLRELDALNAAQFYTSFFRGVMKVKPDFSDAIRSSRIKVLGEVREGDLSHVVYRLKMNVGDVAVSQVTVLPLQKMGGSWGVLLTMESEQVAQNLRNALDKT